MVGLPDNVEYCLILTYAVSPAVRTAGGGKGVLDEAGGVSLGADTAAGVSDFAVTVSLVPASLLVVVESERPQPAKAIAKRTASI